MIAGTDREERPRWKWMKAAPAAARYAICLGSGRSALNRNWRRPRDRGFRALRQISRDVAELGLIKASQTGPVVHRAARVTEAESTGEERLRGSFTISGPRSARGLMLSSRPSPLSPRHRRPWIGRAGRRSWQHRRRWTPSLSPLPTGVDATHPRRLLRSAAERLAPAIPRSVS